MWYVSLCSSLKREIDSLHHRLTFIASTCDLAICVATRSHKLIVAHGAKRTRLRAQYSSRNTQRTASELFPGELFEHRKQNSKVVYRLFGTRSFALLGARADIHMQNAFPNDVTLSSLRTAWLRPLHVDTPAEYHVGQAYTSYSPLGSFGNEKSTSICSVYGENVSFDNSPVRAL